MFGGVGLPGPEQHRERRHRQRDDQRDVANDRNMGEGLVFAEDGFKRRRHRLELQRDVGNRSDDGDQRDGGGDGLALAVAGGDEVGDRGDVLRFRQPDHAAQQRCAERDHQDRPDIDREKIDAGAGGEADRAEERPRGAVDRQRQRVDQRAGATALRRRQPVAVAGNEKQEPDVAECGCDDAPVVQHRACSLWRPKPRSVGNLTLSQRQATAISPQVFRVPPQRSRASSEAGCRNRPGIAVTLSLPTRLPAAAPQSGYSAASDFSCSGNPSRSQTCSSASAS